MAKLLLLLVVCASATLPRFDCTDFALPPEPTDISQLHPGHVSIVMAMGDSITAGFAARGDLLEDRDLSWAIGQGSEVGLTLPFMLQKYALHTLPPHLVEGQSTARIVPNPFHLPHGDYWAEECRMNVAESEGSIGRGSMQEQWAYLLERFTEYKNFDKRWKVLTLWMTANDVCGECDGPLTDKFLDHWGNVTQQLLMNVSTTLTNVYVNLVSTLDLSNVARLQRAHPECKVIHEVINECGCIDKGNATQLEQLDANVHAMNMRLHVIAQSWYTKLQADARTDMAVVVQSFQEGIGSSLDISFLNRLDCFHPSAEAHELLAIGLWDSMLCVDDRKNRCGVHFSKDLPITCPSKSSVFYTGPDIVPGPPPRS